MRIVGDDCAKKLGSVRFQLSRIEYQFRKLEPIRTGIYPEYGGNIEYELFTFFEICYHLKDWIKNSTECLAFSNEVENFINSSKSLRICADIANRFKHMRLDKPRSKTRIGAFKIRTVCNIAAEGSTGETRFLIESATIDTELGKTDCFSLAEECLKEWARFFEDKVA